jgi:serine/threonine protein kinase
MESTVIGRNQVVRRLGVGDMGTLYLAKDPAIERPVAIKLLKAGLTTRACANASCMKPRTAGKLHHPNIITIFDVGVKTVVPSSRWRTSKARPSDVHAPTGAGAAETKLEIIDGVCAALADGHRAGIVHRDVKPAKTPSKRFC